MRRDVSLKRRPLVSEETHVFKADGYSSHRYSDLIVEETCDAGTVPCRSVILIIKSLALYSYLES